MKPPIGIVPEVETMWLQWSFLALISFPFLDLLLDIGDFLTVKPLLGRGLCGLEPEEFIEKLSNDGRKTNFGKCGKLNSRIFSIVVNVGKNSVQVGHGWRSRIFYLKCPCEQRFVCLCKYVTILAKNLEI